MPGVSYTLLLDGAPISPDVLATLQQIEVEEHAELADMLRLDLAIGVREDGSGWTVLDDDLFPRLASLKLLVTIGSGMPEPLIEAYVIETSMTFSNQPGQSMLNVVAMDPTVLMHLGDKVRPWPNMADSDIASALFGEYGLVANVEPTQPVRQAVDVTTIQRGTDIQFLRHLARRNGYECYVEVNALTQQAEGHFHPPRLTQSPQGVLSVNLGEATNVNTFNTRFNMLRPTTAQSTGLDIATQNTQPVQVQSLALTGMGRTPVLNGDRPRRALLSQSGLAQTGELQTYAQAVVDWSAWAITAEGELNTAAYGSLLRAKRPINVRGAGRQFSGTYYVEKVLHTFTGDGCTQRFTLRRNALGLTGQERFMADGALPT
jgi:phage protein D